ncbi:kanadaptin [Condylostylus longicornis]|uniref:kanadaptin n=1 Tax=Condylostylus longicornis TaxID=2530218 RepID=UPI00244DD443|nr:kanadaptin [Condylostylus longicornis]
MEEFKKPSFPSKIFSKSSSIEEEPKEQNIPGISHTNTSLKLVKEKIVLSVRNAINLNCNEIECSYREPKWSGKPLNQDDEYKFEIIKCGTILEEIRNLQTRRYWVIGRLEQNDIAMAHPTISRFHAVFQFRINIQNANENDKIDSGWYIYDLGSTHGTFLNKMRVPPKTYIRVRVGHILKFGASLRSYILQGPAYDEEAESEFTVTELKEKKKHEDELKANEEQMQEEQREKEGISWGMTEDADEETDLSINPYATTNNEELFFDDPKKTLRGFFEREGVNLDYKCDEMSPGTFVCRIDLPIDDANGKQITAEVCHKGKKKECVAQCALEACRILDRYGVLRQSHHEPLKRRALEADSDGEDDFLDRTGDIQRKKMKKTAAGKTITLTYDDLIKQEGEFNLKLKEIESEIALYHENCKKSKEAKAESDDDLDNYMENLAKKYHMVDKTEIRRLRVEEQRLKLEIQKVKQLIKIAKPLDLPALSNSCKNEISNNRKTSSLPLFGKRNKFKFVIEKNSSVDDHLNMPPRELKSDEEEFDEDENLNNIKEEKNLNGGEKKIFSNNENFDFYKTKSKTLNNSNNNSNNEHDEKLNSRLYGPSSTPGIQEMLGLNRTINQFEEYSKMEKSSDEISNNVYKKMSTEQELIPEFISKIKKQNEKGTTIKTFDDLQTTNSNQTIKRPKNRMGNRLRRENVDIDDYEEFVDAQKHSDWVPPKNQSGDGRTSLNDRFGY